MLELIERLRRYEQPHAKWPIIDNAEINSIVNILQSGDISLYGRSGIIAELEDAFCHYFNRKYSLTFNSGTSALFAAYSSLCLKEDDEIIVPTYTFPATITPLLHLKPKIILCDCDPLTGNVTASKIQDKLTAKTKAVVITHLWGLPCEMDGILKLCKMHNLSLIEDNSHSFGSKYKGKLTGTFGDICCISLQGNKFACAGEGGILLTDSSEVYERSTLFANFRKRPYETIKNKYLHQFWETGFGLKLKMHPIAAAISLEQLKKADFFIKLRNDRLQRLSVYLADAIGIDPPMQISHSFMGAWYGYKPKFKKEEFDDMNIQNYIKTLNECGLDVHRPATKPIHLTPLFKHYNNPRLVINNKKPQSRDKTDGIDKFQGAEEYYSNILSFPTFTTEPIDLIDLYGNIVKKIGEKYGK